MSKILRFTNLSGDSLKCRRISYISLFCILLTAMFGCHKNEVSPVPVIGTMYFGLDYYPPGSDTPVFFRLSQDTVYFEFSIVDGDADLGNDTTKHMYDIYIKDYRFDTGYVGYAFPAIDRSIENAKNGINATCLFEIFGPDIINARPDSVHANFEDTSQLEVYVMDRAGHKSNHIITPRLIMLP